MTFSEFRTKLFELKAEACSMSLFSEDVCKSAFKGVAVSRTTWDGVHPAAVEYVTVFNLPSLTTASRAIILDGIQIFLVDEPDVFYALLELPNLIQCNDQQGKMV